MEIIEMSYNFIIQSSASDKKKLTWGWKRKKNFPMSNLLNFQDIESTNRGLNFNAIPEDMPPLCLIIIYIISIKYY